MSENKLNSLIAEKNFLGAYSVIKNSSLSKVDKDIDLGMLANCILKEINSKSNEENVFYKSILYLITKEIPGLQEAYKIQQRMLSPSISFSTLARGLTNISDVQSGKKTLYEGLNDSAEMVKEVFSDNVEAISQKIQDPEEQAKIFDTLADGINTGIKSLGGIFDILEGKDRKKNSEE